MTWPTPRVKPTPFSRPAIEPRISGCRKFNGRCRRTFKSTAGNSPRCCRSSTARPAWRSPWARSSSSGGWSPPRPALTRSASRRISGSWLGLLLLFGWTCSLFYHLCNGIRHLVWDTGHGLDLQDRLCERLDGRRGERVLTLVAWVAGIARCEAERWPTRRLRSPLGRAIGLGSAKEGVEHWWAQRVTAMALVPLLCGS